MGLMGVAGPAGYYRLMLSRRGLWPTPQRPRPTTAGFRELLAGVGPGLTAKTANGSLLPKRHRRIRRSRICRSCQSRRSVPFVLMAIMPMATCVCRIAVPNQLLRRWVPFARAVIMPTAVTVSPMAQARRTYFRNPVPFVREVTTPTGIIAWRTDVPTTDQCGTKVA